MQCICNDNCIPQVILSKPFLSYTPNTNIALEYACKKYIKIDFLSGSIIVSYVCYASCCTLSFQCKGY
ncbi:hypothetical protein XELAEV_18015028mg [Xenopus laevis]|uniref:Uncharacterized protein n=1 Tax=Xenopus laevis TaxID=8355 RepID=A0A974DJH5_XENLA|nr:hypothetical protein XELAEV_18015028mg [Xenopus laevis]